ncbi:protein TBATA-like isoform X1 [Antedon mediterranea]|uniref:protein TBATA-like isoform X1 n=1 Tax=Antedon mediterranea TaxID=105859 RepID=UPI003AF9C727
MAVFRPQGKPLIVPNALSHNVNTGMLPTTRKDFAGSRPATSSGTRFGQLSQNPFFTRHNPHPGRVRHIKGLLDVPICTVHDDGYMSNVKYGKAKPPSTADSRKLYSYSIPQRINRHNYKIQNLNPTLNSGMFPINTITGLSSYPMGFKEKAYPKLGVVPMTDSWRDELREFTEKAGLSLPREVREQQDELPRRTSVYSAETGRLIPSRSMQRGYSRQRQREPHYFNHIQPEQANESLILEMLCQILQTDSISAVQSWLVSANHREKDLVLDMIRTAMLPDEQTLRQQFDPSLMHQQPPSNMNLQNGYGEIDKFHEEDQTRYSRYAYDEDVRKSASRKSDRKGSSKADILKIHDSPRAESPSKGVKKPPSN